MHLKTNSSPGSIREFYIQPQDQVNYVRAISERETTKGCVQASVDFFTFWNIIIDTLLQKLTGYCQAFAEDVILVIFLHTVSMEEYANAVRSSEIRLGK